MRDEQVPTAETTDFFEADKVYVNGENPFRAPELTPEFWCKLVATNPTHNTLWAVGWHRPGHFSKWDYGLSAYTLEQWTGEKGAKWVESPFEDKTGTGA